MALDDVYEIVDVQSLYGQEVLNVYYYQQDILFLPVFPTIAQSLADRFQAEILPSLLACQTGDILHTAIRVRNLFDDSDAYEKPVSAPGTGWAASSSTVPAFTSIGVTLAGDNAAVRDGAKRIAGTLNTPTDGIITDATLLGALNTLMTELEDWITDGGGVPTDIWKPVVVKRVRSGAPGAYEYRLPENLAETVLSNVVDALYALVMTTQISRKIGVGA